MVLSFKSEDIIACEKLKRKTLLGFIFILNFMLQFYSLHLLGMLEGHIQLCLLYCMQSKLREKRALRIMLAITITNNTMFCAIIDRARW